MNFLLTGKVANRRAAQTHAGLAVPAGHIVSVFSRYGRNRLTDQFHNFSVVPGFADVVFHLREPDFYCLDGRALRADAAWKEC